MTRRKGRQSREETVELQINDATRIKLCLPRRLFNLAIINEVDLDIFVTTCLECLLHTPGGPVGVLINPSLYATQTIGDDEIETRRLIRMDGVEVHHEQEDLNPDLPFYG